LGAQGLRFISILVFEQLFSTRDKGPAGI